ncbi:unnamed protein product [Bursaphelenchus okinawaensis]|uniref:SGNH domain-containing protein n=1 Tax=Bursaphelenchus okinawaensis TaxID=465554 RepID=A0A811KRB1_9BILA|nr:unnamed protein product [Bursaphelenchus okinawaensis]CAG9109948.1 unnamed protein product [Bursaphelenchus okinawaensis]
MLYGTFFTTQMYVIQSTPHVETTNSQIVAWTDPKYLDFIEQVYNKRGQSLGYTVPELSRLNLEMIYFSEIYFPQCRKDSAMKYMNLKWYHYFFYGCSIDGLGTKEVVVIGNSMARDIFSGFQQLWRHTYKRLTIAANPTEAVFYTENAAVGNKYLNLLKAWDRPIDIIIVQQAHFEIPKEYVDTKMQQAASVFYHELGKLVKEVVMIGTPEIWSTTIVQILFKIVENQEDYNKPSVDYAPYIAHNAKMRRIVENVPCEKCVTVDFCRSICSKLTNKCRIILPNGIIVFRDYIHTTLVGGFMYAQEFIDVYNNKFVA